MAQEQTKGYVKMQFGNLLLLQIRTGEVYAPCMKVGKLSEQEVRLLSLP